MYKFMVIEGSCGQPYNLKRSEDTCNEMAKKGFELVECYQTKTPGCMGQGSKAVLVLIFRSSEDEALIQADSLEEHAVETVDEAIALLTSAGFKFAPKRDAEDFRVTFPYGSHEWFDPDRLIALAKHQAR